MTKDNIRSFEGKVPTLGNNAFIDPTALLVGDVTVGDDGSLWPNVVARGDIHSITIGARTNIQDGTILHVTHAGEFNATGHALDIGDDVTVGHGVILHGCSIGNRCLVGMGCVVMDGCEVQEESIIGAGTLVSPGKVLESGYLWLGQPARRIREITAEERAYFAYSAQHYVDLARRHQQALAAAE